MRVFYSAMHQNAAPDNITLKAHEPCQPILDDVSFRDIKESIEVVTKEGCHSISRSQH